MKGTTFMILETLIMLSIGIYTMLIAFRIIPRKPREPEKYEIWYKKVGKLLKIGSILIMFGGVIKLVMLFL